MQINRTTLAEAVKKCLPGVESGNVVLDGTDTLVFTKGAVHSYNDSIHVSALLPESEIVGCIKAVEFAKLIGKLQGDTVTIEQVEGKWVLTCGETEVELALFSDAIMKYVDSLKIGDVDWKALPEDFQEGLKLTKIAGNTNPVRGACVAGNKLYSTDTIRINEYTFPTALDPFWIDDPAVAELIKIGTLVEYAVSPAWAHFRTKDGAVFSAKIREYSQFPLDGLRNHIQSVSEAPTLAGNALPLALGEAVNRVSVFGAEMHGIVSVGLVFRKDFIEARSARSSGRAKEKVKWAEPFAEDPAVECTVDYTFITEAAAKVAKFELKDCGESKVLRFYSDKFVQLAVTVSA